jgi:hypothetical protein
MRLTRVLSPLIVLTAMAVPASVVHAQRYWHDEQGRDAFRLDFGLPFLKGDGHKFFTGTMVPSLTVRAGEGIRVEADLPLARAGVEGASSLRLGNPHLGLRIGDDAKPVSGILGIRFPASRRTTTPIAGQAVQVGTISDYDDFEAYAPNLLTLRGGLEFRRTRSNGLLFGVRGATSLQVNTSGDPAADSEMSLDYGVRTGYEGARLLATAAITGRYVLTAPAFGFACATDDDECNPKGFNERTHHQVTGVVELRSMSFRPRVTFRVPLDEDLRNIAGAVLGVGVSIGR